MPVNFLCEEIQAAKTAGRYLNYVRSLIKAKVLILFEDPVMTEAIVDRLIHPFQKITLKGEKSYREKLSEKNPDLKN